MSEELKLRSGVTLEALKGSSVEYLVRVGGAVTKRIGRTSVLFGETTPSGLVIHDSIGVPGRLQPVGIRWETGLDGFQEIELHPDQGVAVFRLSRELVW